MKKVSDKQKDSNRIIAEIKAEKIKKLGRICLFCRRKVSSVDLVHIIRRSYSERLKTDEKNVILGCRECHDTFDNGDARELEKFPTFEPVLNRMKKLDMYYYNRFVRKRLGRDV